MESNSQGYRYICIPLEEEDKLNQHFDIDAAAAGCWRAEQNESSLNLSEAHKCETDRCAANATICMEF